MGGFLMKKVDVVLDTDTYNEVDDQFALIYAALSDSVNLKAVYAAPFFNEMSNSPGDGMERSYNEIVRLLKLINIDSINFAFRGSNRYMGDVPCKNDAVTDLISRARAYNENNKLVVAAIGAPTNVASAIKLAPDIISNIKVVWLGGNEFSYPSASEFNLKQDYEASKTLFNCGIELVQVPCQTVASHLMVGVPELQACLGSSNIAKALIDIVDEAVEGKAYFTRVIWDIAVIAYIVNPSWVLTKKEHSPILNRSNLYSHDKRRHLIDIAYKLNRNAIFNDLYREIRKLG